MIGDYAFMYNFFNAKSLQQKINLLGITMGSYLNKQLNLYLCTFRYGTHIWEIYDQKNFLSQICHLPILSHIYLDKVVNYYSG